MRTTIGHVTSATCSRPPSLGVHVQGPMTGSHGYFRKLSGECARDLLGVRFVNINSALLQAMHVASFVFGKGHCTKAGDNPKCLAHQMGAAKFNFLHLDQTLSCMQL